MTPRPTLQQAIKQIKAELQAAAGRAAAPTASCSRRSGWSSAPTFDIEMMEATGSCAGIENYSRYLTGRQPGEPPPTLFEYIPENALLFVDESHVTVPQIGGMYRGDYRRKCDPGRVRLPPALLHRQPPAQVRGVGRRCGRRPCSSRPRPAAWEMERTGGVFIEQVIRPTGLIDPPVRDPPGRARRSTT